MILYRAGSWLLIYLSISLGYWLSWGPELHSLRFYGEPWVQPGISFVMISVGMMIVGLYLFWISNARQCIGSFAAGHGGVPLFFITEERWTMVILRRRCCWKSSEFRIR